jgi:hypothetical protein
VGSRLRGLSGFFGGIVTSPFRDNFYFLAKSRVYKNPKLSTLPSTSLFNFNRSVHVLSEIEKGIQPSGRKQLINGRKGDMSGGPVFWHSRNIKEKNGQF